MTQFPILLLNLLFVVPFASPKLLLRPRLRLKPRPFGSALSPEYPRSSIIGIYKPILDLNDWSVQEIANFAVAEYSKRVNSSYSLDSVVTAISKTSTLGTVYNFVVKATNGTDSGYYTAFVLDKPLTNTKKLLGFVRYYKITRFPYRVQPISPTSPRVQGLYKEIVDLNSTLIQDIAKFSMAEYSKWEKSTYSLVKLKSAEYYPMGTGNLYRLFVEATNGTVSGSYKAIVADMPWNFSRKLLSFVKPGGYKVPPIITSFRGPTVRASPVVVVLRNEIYSISLQVN